MQSSLTFSNIAALFGIMLVGALVPGVSVLAVSARSAAFGFAHGVLTTLGIVVGDIVFIIIAIYGLSVLAEMMGSNFILIKYLGGAYLIWLGIVLCRSRSKTEPAAGGKDYSLLSSFLTGLLITLGDQKAILFYLGFFPAFLDLSTISIFDTIIIIVMATVAICGAKLGYAFIVARAGLISKSPKVNKGINIVAGSVMIGVGVIVMARV